MKRLLWAVAIGVIIGSVTGVIIGLLVVTFLS